MTFSRRSVIQAGIMGALGVLSACTNARSNTAASSSAAGTTSSAGGTSGAQATTTTPVPTTSAAPPADVLGAGVVNALIAGADTRTAGSFGGNSDVILLAQISADRSRLTLVSAARDTYVPSGGGGGGGKINGTYSRGGIDGLKQAMSTLLGGIPIHLTAVTNFGGFTSMATVLNGITVLNKHASTVGKAVFPQGEFLLPPPNALPYVRQRKTLPQGDLDRAERHRATIIGMLKGMQAVSAAYPNMFASVTGSLMGSAQITGFDPARAGELVGPLSKLDLSQTTSLMVPITGFGNVGGASVNLVNEPKCAELAAGLLAGDVSGYVAKYGTDYTPG